MVRHNWKLIGTTNSAKVFVDYKNSVTKIESYKYIYIHKGIYPYHNPDYSRRFKVKKVYN